MKIGFDSKRLFCNFTGLGNYSRTLVSNLAKYYPQEPYYLYTTSVKECPKTLPFLKQSVYQIYIAKALLKAFWRSFSILKQLKKDQIELYHGLSHELPIGIHKSSIKSVVTIHDLIFKIYPETYSVLDRFMYNWKFKSSCQNANRIIAISESTKKDIVNYYNIDPNKIEVLYQACQPLYYELAGPSAYAAVLERYQIPMDYILSVGTVQERKNLKLVIEAYTHLPKELRLPLVVVGNGGKYQKEVKAMIQKEGLEDLVIWLENLETSADLQILYQAARLLVYPSFYEGFGLPVAEALLSKTPVITADTSSLREAGGPHSIYVNPRDSRAMAVAIETVLTKPLLVEKMITEGYEYAQEQFNPAKLTKQLMHLYEGVLKGE